MKPVLGLGVVALISMRCLGVTAEFKIGVHTFSLPQGYSIERIATTNQTLRPISASFDDKGRLYVTDSSGTNDKQDVQLKNPTHRLMRLEDTNGDGVFDRSMEFANRLAFPEGCLWFDGSVYVAVPPNILRLTDTNGDGVADQREEWYQGGVLTGCANDVHGPYLGLDGRIYWTKGAFAKLDLVDGRGRPIRDRAAHIFRKRPDGSDFEAIMSGGMDNPVEVAFTSQGEPLFTTTFVDFTKPGNRDGLCHAVYGSVFGKLHDVIEDRVILRTGDVLPPLVQYGAGVPSGLCRYEGTQWGPENEGVFFASLFNLHKIARHQLSPAGGAFTSDSTDFLVSDNLDFHPTDVLEDADGSLLVVDTGGWYKMCCPSSQLAKADVLGGIYRIRRVGSPSIADPRGLDIAWQGLGTPQLISLLGDTRPAVRELARRRLAAGGESSVASLAEFVQTSTKSPDRIEALWTLSRIDSAKAREAEVVAIGDSDPAVAHVAAKISGIWRNPLAAPQLVKLVRSSASEGKFHLARVSIEALGRGGKSKAFEADALLRSLVQVPGVLQDRLIEHSLVIALIEAGDTLSLRRIDWVKESRLAKIVLMALDQMEGGQLQPLEVTPLLSSQEMDLRQAALWVIRRHPEWGGSIAEWLNEKLSQPGNAEKDAELVDLAAQFSNDKAIQEVIGKTASKGPTGVASLNSMAHARLNSIPDVWGEAVKTQLASRDTAVLQAAVKAARAFGTAKTNSVSLNEALLGIARQPNHPEALRLESLAALPPKSEIPDDLFQFVIGRVDSNASPTVRALATTVLSRLVLTESQRAAIAHSLKSASPLEINSLIELLSNAPPSASSSAVESTVLASLREATSFASVRYDVLKAWLAKQSTAIQTEGLELAGRLNTDAAAQQKHLETVMGSIGHGDVRRGQLLFNSPKAACSTCHALGYLGGKVGPDLTRIGEIRKERDILESILFPNSTFVRSYEPMVVTLKSGEQVAGILKRDDDRGIHLVTGPTAELDIQRGDIADVQPGSVSLMPGGLEEQFSKQEIADLLAFLKDTTWGAR